MAKGTINKVILLGRVGVDPETRYMPSGVAVTNLSIATNDGYKDKQTGQYIENTEWHRVVSFGKQAESISQYTNKGSLLYIEGRIRTNKWQDQSGQDRYTTEIIATDFQFIGGRSDGSINATSNKDFNTQKPSSDQNKFQNLSPQNTKQQDLSKISDFNDDDIPF